jgi:hypothetical protein
MKKVNCDGADGPDQPRLRQGDPWLAQGNGMEIATFAKGPRKDDVTRERLRDFGQPEGVLLDRQGPRAVSEFPHDQEDKLLNDAAHRIEDPAFREVPARLARFLLGLAERRGTPLERGSPAPRPGGAH